MSNEITRRQIDELQAVDYQIIRPHLRTGDLLFASGDLAFSRAIRLVTNSPWSHVGIIVRLKEFDRILVLESVIPSGVRFSPMSKYFVDKDFGGHGYKGSLVIARHNFISIQDDQSLADFVGYGIDRLTKPYGYLTIIGILIRIVAKIGSLDKRRDSFICSELVDFCVRKAFSDRIKFYRKDKKFISPSDVWLDENIECISRLSSGV